MFITEINYRIQGYHKKETFDANGDLTTVEYYANYDSGTETFSNLKVKETRIYTRDIGSGLLTKRDMTIEWYKGGGSLSDTKTTEKHYDSQKGYKSNIKARKNLINSASMWLYGDLIAEFGQATGEANAKEFLRDVGSERGGYIAGDLQPLLDAVQASARAYITGARKSTLDTILNIAY